MTTRAAKLCPKVTQSNVVGQQLTMFLLCSFTVAGTLPVSLYHTTVLQYTFTTERGAFAALHCTLRYNNKSMLLYVLYDIVT